MFRHLKIWHSVTIQSLIKVQFDTFYHCGLKFEDVFFSYLTTMSTFVDDRCRRNDDCGGVVHEVSLDSGKGRCSLGAPSVGPDLSSVATEHPEFTRCCRSIFSRFLALTNHFLIRIAKIKIANDRSMQNFRHGWWQKMLQLPFRRKRTSWQQHTKVHSGVHLTNSSLSYIQILRRSYGTIGD